MPKVYRIVETITPKYDKEPKYFIEKKVLLWWSSLGDFSDYGCGRYTFDTIENAEAFIAGGCINPADPIKKVIKYV